MKKVSLLMMIAMFLIIGNVKAQEVEVLIEDDFSAYTVGNKIATESETAGNNWWTTWNKKPGTAEDGVVAEYEGDKCAHLTYGNDQVLLLGGTQSGVYDLEFDILVPNGKNGYFNILHDFNAGNSVWALESHLHMSNSSTVAPNKGFVQAGGLNAEIVCVYDEWMHFRLHVDTDADVAQYYYTLQGEEEVKVLEWQWSLNTQGVVTGRKLDAMDFFPPKDANTSEFYLDNFKCTRIGGETAPEFNFDKESLSANADQDDFTSVEFNIENTGTSIAEYIAWVDYGVGAGGSTTNIVNYDEEIGDKSALLGAVNADTEIEIGVMFPGESYVNSVAGTYITHVAYPFVESSSGTMGIVEGTPVTFRIYGQGANGQPGEILSEKVYAYDEIVPGDWTIVELDEPVALTGFDFWYSLTFMHAAVTEQVGNYPIVHDGSDEPSPYGHYMRMANSGVFYTFEEIFGDQTSCGNLHMRVVCTGDPVVGGWASLDKSESSLAIGGSETVTLEISTIGLQGGKTYDASIVFVTNEPQNEIVEIPISLYVWGDNVEEILSDIYNIYPNPTTGMVTVEAENVNYIAVYNSVGQLVNVVKNENNTVDMSAYENGVYFFNIVDNAGHNSVQRVVVAK